MGESHAVEKVVLSTLNLNWLLSLPLYLTGYTKQGMTPGPGISTGHLQMSSTLLRQIKRCHRQTELFNQLALEIVPLKPRTQLNYLDCNEKIRWEAPDRRSHQGPVNLFCLTTVHLINSSSPRIPRTTSRITFFCVSALF